MGVGNTIYSYTVQKTTESFTATKILFMYSQKKNCAASGPISTFMYLWGSVHIFSCSRIGRPIMRLYKSLTDTWTWKSGLWPRNSFSGNICFNFLVLCLCSVQKSLICFVLLFDSLPTTNLHFSVNFCVFTSLVLSLRSCSSKWGWFVMGRPVHSFTPAISCMLPLMASC